MEIKLEKDERIDELGIGDLKIIQNEKGFCFGMDSVLLANFTKNMKKHSKVLDLGTGTGIIPTIICGKTTAEKVVGVEVQEEVARMAQKSIHLNHLEDRFTIEVGNILDLQDKFSKGSFDVVVTNPPYKKKNTGMINESETKVIARHEITADLEDFICVAKDMLKELGEFYLVHRPERLVDILHLMRKYKIEPKEIQFVCSYTKSSSKLVLIKGVKYGKAFLKVLPNLYLYEEDGSYTEEIRKMYDE